MLLTEKEAQEKWCPHVRQLGTLKQAPSPEQPYEIVATGSQNRGYMLGAPLHTCMCIASQCSQWRWCLSNAVDDQLVAAWEEVRAGEKVRGIKLYRAATGHMLKEAAHWAALVSAGQIEKPSIERRGFCGLAGKPE